jgi:hypothetical protein
MRWRAVLRRGAAPGSGAADGERSNALSLIEKLTAEHGDDSTNFPASRNPFLTVTVGVNGFEFRFPE